jgi:hypothetical protein
MAPQRAPEAATAAPPPPAPAPPPPAPAPPAVGLLDVAARLPGAAALIVRALGKQDRKSLRATHPLLRAAVARETTKLTIRLREGDGGGEQPPLDARRWPALRTLALSAGDLEAEAFLRALCRERWAALAMLRLSFFSHPSEVFIFDSSPDTLRARSPTRRRRSPCGGWKSTTSGSRQRWSAACSAAPSFGEAGGLAALLASWRGAPRLRALSVQSVAGLPFEPEMTAAGGCGWALEELKLSCRRALSNRCALSADGIRALAGAPRFALRRLDLNNCRLGAAALRELAAAPWPLEELDLSGNNMYSDPDAGPLLAVLSQHARLERLKLNDCNMAKRPPLRR